MQSIGERLEEARKRRGISIREASEATKIRGDFLLKFENNEYDVGLPDLYVRGFLRNYASFLKIDPEKIVTDFNATLLGEAKGGRRDGRELFGRMELPDRPRPAVEGGTPVGPTAPRRRNEEPADPSPRGGGGGGGYNSGNRGGNPDTANYVKVGLIVAAGIAALLVIVWLVMMIINAAQGPERPTSDRPAAPVESNVPAQNITLIASGDLWVKVTQVSDNFVLFDGQLARGERKILSRRGAVRLGYNVGANLQVDVSGKAFRMTSEGMGFSTIP